MDIIEVENGLKTIGIDLGERSIRSYVARQIANGPLDNGGGRGKRASYSHDTIFEIAASRYLIKEKGLDTKTVRIIRGIANDLEIHCFLSCLGDNRTPSDADEKMLNNILEGKPEWAIYVGQWLIKKQKARIACSEKYNNGKTSLFESESWLSEIREMTLKLVEVAMGGEWHGLNGRA